MAFQFTSYSLLSGISNILLMQHLDTFSHGIKSFTFSIQSMLFMQPLTLLFICIIFDGNWVQASLSDIPQICFSHIEKNCLEIIILLAFKRIYCFLSVTLKMNLQAALRAEMAFWSLSLVFIVIALGRACLTIFGFTEKFNSTQVCNNLRK